MGACQGAVIREGEGEGEGGDELMKYATVGQEREAEGAATEGSAARATSASREPAYRGQRRPRHVGGAKLRPMSRFIGDPASKMGRRTGATSDACIAWRTAWGHARGAGHAPRCPAPRSPPRAPTRCYRRSAAQGTAARSAGTWGESAPLARAAAAQGHRQTMPAGSEQTGLSVEGASPGGRMGGRRRMGRLAAHAASS